MSFQTPVLVAGLLTTGAFNTLLNKLQDMACVENCQDPDPLNRRHYEQPLWQTLNMFIGETCCLAVFFLAYFHDKRSRLAEPVAVSPRGTASPVSAIHRKPTLSPLPVSPGTGTAGGSRSSYSSLSPLLPTELDNDNIDGIDTHILVKDVGPGPLEPKELRGADAFLLWLPTLCDLCATTLMNVGLIYISASIYQMLRGAVVLFTGTFSVIFLRRRLQAFQWIALVLVVCGVAIVGGSSILFPSSAATAHSLAEIVSAGPTGSLVHAMDGDEQNSQGGGTTAAIGVSMVLFAQIFTATQFVIEERIMERYNVVPLLAVGLEGFFGLFSVLAAMPLLYLAFGRSHPGGFFDITSGYHQFVDNPPVWIPGILIALSIAFFNWFGLSVTRSINATARSTLDTCRTIIIWIISMSLGWESFRWMQVLGFGVLIYGTFIFNGVINPPFCRPAALSEEESGPLISSPAEAIEDDGQIAARA